MVPINRDKRLYFRRGFKYVTTRDYYIELDVIPFEPIDLPWIKMDMQGRTHIWARYAWNGASGPTIDTLTSMIGSLVHDLGYQLIRLGLIDPCYKEYFDNLLAACKDMGQGCKEIGWTLLQAVL